MTTEIANFPMLRLIPEGEKFSDFAVARKDNPDVLDIRFAIRKGRKEDGHPRYQKDLVLDFTGCSREDLLMLAEPTVRISLQRRLRDLGDGMLDARQLAEVNVLRDVINAGRAPVDPRMKARRALAALGMSEADIEEVLAKTESNT